MKLICVALLSLAFSVIANAQAPSVPFRIVKIEPFDQVVPGQIVKARVEGVEADPMVVDLETDKFTVEVIQDKFRKKSKVRAIETMGAPRSPASGISDPSDMNWTPVVSFVVPLGLVPGSAQIIVSYKKQLSAPATLVVIEKPLGPRVTIMMGSLSAQAGMMIRGALPEPDNRLLRGSKDQFVVEPLVDPADKNCSIQVQFKQNGEVFDAVTRVFHVDRKITQNQGITTFARAGDYIDVETPAGLALGSAEVEVRVRALGQVSAPTVIKVKIADLL